MIETRRLKNVVIFIQTIVEKLFVKNGSFTNFSFVGSRNWFVIHESRTLNSYFGLSQAVLFINYQRYLEIEHMIFWKISRDVAMCLAKLLNNVDENLSILETFLIFWWYFNVFGLICNFENVKSILVKTVNCSASF